MIIMSVFFFAPLRLREKNYFYLFGRSWPKAIIHGVSHFFLTPCNKTQSSSKTGSSILKNWL